MNLQSARLELPRVAPRAGQIVLPPAASNLAPSAQISTLVRLSDPDLSELNLEEFSR